MLEQTLMATDLLRHPVCFFSRGSPAPAKGLQTVKFGDASVLEIPGSGLHRGSNQFSSNQSVPILSFDVNKLAMPPSPIYNPIFLDIQDNGCPDSVVFSIGIAEHYERQKKMLQFLRSGSSFLDRGDLNFYIPGDMTGLHMLPMDVNNPLHNDISSSLQLYRSGGDSHASFIYPGKEFCSLNTFEVFHEHSCDPLALVHPNGRVLFPGTETEMKHLHAMITDFYLAKKAVNQIQRRETVVPYFRRSSRRTRGTPGHTKPKSVAAPAKRPEEIKPSSMPKKKRNKHGNKKLAYMSGYSHVCESFLSVILVRNPDRTAFISLKRNSRELFQLLTQFSAGISGLGLAVLFSIIFKRGNGRLVPFYTTRVLSTGLALGLFWLSSSINALRDTIIEITKGLSNVKLEGDEITNKLERRAKQVFMGAAAVVTVAILKLA